MMAAMEKSVAQGRSVQFSSMVCNSIERQRGSNPVTVSSIPRGFSVLPDTTQTHTPGRFFPASRVIARTFRQHRSWPSRVLSHVTTGTIRKFLKSIYFSSTNNLLHYNRR
jgi:hypothetical protein